ncbi:MAG: ABC transporter permease subunit [Archangium sp.]|nr:ABC transporter permease subunit [Archangium sp.]MDP3569050.1 ABC transporter permease subunit [Archangium sp.]
MRTIFAIFKKELTSHLTTLWAWVVFTVMALLSSAFFVLLLGGFKQAQDIAREVPGGWSALPAEAQQFRNLTDGVMISLWGTILVVTLFVAPFLSMRLFAEERRNKTFELLMTTPIRPIEIVLGKYLGAVGLIVCTLGVTIVFPIILSIIGSSESGSALEWRTVLLGYFGLLLWGATNMAIGMFISSLTESQMVAAFVSFAVALLWMLVSSVAPRAEEPLRSVLNYLAFDSQLQNLIKGVLDLKPIVFFTSVIAFFVLLTHRSIEAQRWT